MFGKRNGLRFHKKNYDSPTVIWLHKKKDREKNRPTYQPYGKFVMKSETEKFFCLGLTW